MTITEYAERAYDADEAREAIELQNEVDAYYAMHNERIALDMLTDADCDALADRAAYDLSLAIC